MCTCVFMGTINAHSGWCQGPLPNHSCVAAAAACLRRESGCASQAHLNPFLPPFQNSCACVCVEGRSPAERRSHCLGIWKGERFQQLYLSNSSSVALLGSAFHKMRTHSPHPLASFPFLYLFLFKSLPLPLSDGSVYIYFFLIKKIALRNVSL